jgi:hypothetical protein
MKNMEQEKEIKYKMDSDLEYSSRLDTYVGHSIILIGNRMEKVFQSVQKENKGKDVSIYWVTQEDHLSFNPELKLSYEEYKEPDDYDLVKITDSKGRRVNEDGSPMPISSPEILNVKFKHLESERELRHASVILSGLIGDSLVTSISSDLAENFSRNIHSSLVYRRQRFKNILYSFVLTRSTDATENFNLQVVKNNIKSSAENFKEIKAQVTLKHSPFQKKLEEIENEELIDEIRKINEKRSNLKGSN